MTQRTRSWRLLVTGSRVWADEDLIRRELQARFEPGIVLVSGACPQGADAIAERIWRELGGAVERHPAQWHRYGRRAGMVRNLEMVNAGADEVLAFILDHSPGATAAAAMASRAGIPVSAFTARTEAAGAAAQACLFDLGGETG